MLMKKKMTVAILGGFVLALHPAQLMATVIAPIGLSLGSQYQLIFITAGIRDATSSNIDDYNAFVSAQAALSSSLPEAIWHAGWFDASCQCQRQRAIGRASCI
jgi:hypothetical protein